MLEEEAVELLDQRVKDGGNLVTAIEGRIPALKRLRDQCLEAGIPSMLGPCSHGGGCSTKGTLVIDEKDVPRVAHLLRTDWERTMVEEGLAPVQPRPGGDPDALACPACGCTDDPADGACPDCGLALG